MRGCMSPILRLDDGDSVAGGGRSSLLSMRQWRAIAEFLHLSDRECQVIRGIFDGQNETEIGETLGISSHTTHGYLRRIYRKLGVHDRCGLIVQIFETYIQLSAIVYSNPVRRFNPMGETL